MILKLMVGVTCVVVTIAAAAFTLHTVLGGRAPAAGPTGPGGGTGAPGEPGEPLRQARVVSTGPAVAATTRPIVVPPDDPLQPSYRPINQPALLQLIRRKGHTYHSRVVGRVAGQASKKDWGVRGVAFFEYVYAVESRGFIESNDGATVVEVRTFSRADENLFVSAYQLRLELPDKLGDVIDVLGMFGGPKGVVAARTVNGALDVVKNVQVPISREAVEAARRAGLFVAVPDMDPARFERELKMFTQGPDNRLLQGKTVRITFVDGQGVTNIDPIGCEISDQEREVIVRTNFVMDHYIFPDEPVEPGKKWAVKGSVFGGFLDPRLRGKVGGEVNVGRSPDFIDEAGVVSQRLRLIDGQMTVSDGGSGNVVTGQLTGLRGICVLPETNKVITSAVLSGFADYRNVSTDHLLFEAQTTVQPKIQVRYECTVEKGGSAPSGPATAPSR